MAVSKEDLIETLSGMSILEVTELVSELEEKWGVSAAAAVAAPVAAPVAPSFFFFSPLFPHFFYDHLFISKIIIVYDTMSAEALESISTDDLMREVQRRIDCATKPEKRVILIGASLSFLFFF